jgi:hypothetical protein
MRSLKSLSIAKAGRQNTCERDGRQYRFQTGHVWPPGIPLRTVESAGDPCASNNAACFAGLK